MIQSEYIRSLNCNYQRILLDKKPEEKRYQYCILSRGGIKGLLPCDLRYINGQAYLYYDITSKQNVSQMYRTRNVTRAWLKDFLWGLKQVQQELGRFLLDTGNILWYPEQIFQDLETNLFCFLYVPYYEGDSGFGKLMEFLAEHIDYEDELLVDCVYHIYEQHEKAGVDYLQSLIFEDTKCLEEVQQTEGESPLADAGVQDMSAERTKQTDCEKQTGREKLANRTKQADRESLTNQSKQAKHEKSSVQFKSAEREAKSAEREAATMLENGKGQAGHTAASEGKKGLLGIFEGKRNRNKRQREEYRQVMHREMAGIAVAEDSVYEGEAHAKGGINAENDSWEGEYGRTIFVEAAPDTAKVTHRLLSPEGKLLATLEAPTLSIGKKKEEVDLVFEEASVSRMHARITMEKGVAYLEDLNSTNGTFKNGLRLQPYEKRKLDEGDEIKCGRVAFIFR